MGTEFMFGFCVFIPATKNICIVSRESDGHNMASFFGALVKGLMSKPLRFREPKQPGKHIFTVSGITGYAQGTYGA